MRPFILVTAFAAILASSGARADLAAPGPTRDQQSVQAFVETSEACQEWGNGCVVCRRAADNGLAACSLPGIACMPGPIACGSPQR